MEGADAAAAPPAAAAGVGAADGATPGPAPGEEAAAGVEPTVAAPLSGVGSAGADPGAAAAPGADCPAAPSVFGARVPQAVETSTAQNSTAPRRPFIALVVMVLPP